MASRDISHNAIGDYANIHQGDTYNQNNFTFNTDAPNSHLKDISETDPHHDRRRILETKGPLLRASYYWIVEHQDFKQWCNNPESPILWIKGDPGKGKTMLLCGIIEELEEERKPQDSEKTIAYFFCQATDSRLNTARAILGGLIFSLIKQEESLISHVLEKQKNGPKNQFEGPNAWFALCEIFEAMIQDPALTDITLIVDAMDECVSEQNLFLRFVVKPRPRVRWLLSSRNKKEIEQELQSIPGRLSLELKQNAEQVSHAVEKYIDHSILEIESIRDDQALQDGVRAILQQKANGTFLWVALVIEQLRKADEWEFQDVLESIPEGLESLYELMMGQINKLKRGRAELCKKLLSTITVAYRPLHLEELGIFWNSDQINPEKKDQVLSIARMCGSFLNVREDIVYFVHQSVKDFMVLKASERIMTLGIGQQHHIMFTASLDIMSKTLRRDMYDLKDIGKDMDDIVPPSPDPLALIRYASIYWVDHLHDAKLVEYDDDLKEGGTVDRFLRGKYLYWLEALALFRSIGQGVGAIQKLQTLIFQAEASQLADLVEDAHRFILFSKGIADVAPLQLYSSALVFAPEQSIVRRAFEHALMIQKPVFLNAPIHWDSHLQTLEGHKEWVTSVAFSPNSVLLASGDSDGEIRIWRADTGVLERRINIRPAVDERLHQILTLAFSADSQLLASASTSSTVKTWRVDSGICMQEFDCHFEVRFATFSSNLELVALATREFMNDTDIHIWHNATGSYEHLMEYKNAFGHPAFSPDSKLIAFGGEDNSVEVRGINTGECIQSLIGLPGEPECVAFSSDSTLIASGVHDYSSFRLVVLIWHVDTANCMQTLQFDGASSAGLSPTFSPSSEFLASARNDVILLWRVDTGIRVHEFNGHTDLITSIAFAPNSKIIASGSEDHTIKVWRVGPSDSMPEVQSHRSGARISGVAISPNSKFIATRSFVDGIVGIWSIDTGTCLHELKGHKRNINSVAFSPNSEFIASSSEDAVRVWRIDQGTCVHSFQCYGYIDGHVAFSPNSTFLAAKVDNGTVRIWRVDTGDCVHALRSHSSAICFSPDSAFIASASEDGITRIWRIDTGDCMHSLEGHPKRIRALAFSPDLALIALVSHHTVWIWRIDTGACVQSTNVGYYNVRRISFEPGNRHLLTEIYQIPAFPDESYEDSEEAALPYRPGYIIDTNTNWIILNGEKYLWLPQEFRPLMAVAWDVLGSIITIGCSAGRVAILKFPDIAVATSAGQLATSSTFVEPSIVIQPSASNEACSTAESSTSLLTGAVARQKREKGGCSCGCVVF